ncbi:Homeobox-leucine zipper protein HDG12 [Raphanus sativus]|nr:Homeobox-leucine zipper protein HDG12 [Raphanus sativus]
MAAREGFSIAAKFMGRPLSHPPPLLNQMQISPLELLHSVPLLDFDLLQGSCSSMAVSSLLSLPNVVISDMDKFLMTNIAVNGCLDVVSLKSYENAFPRLSSHGGKNHNL